jgi:hypothetical protein
VEHRSPEVLVVKVARLVDRSWVVWVRPFLVIQPEAAADISEAARALTALPVVLHTYFHKY